MQSWIAGLLAVLGALLVLLGAAVTALNTVASSTPAPVGTETKPGFLTRLRQLRGADRLLLWGVVLLVIAAIAAGAISFNLGATAGSR